MLGLVSGLALASIYVLIALSITIVLAASGVFNFAQGTIVMIGTVLAYVLGVRMGWPELTVVAAVVGVGVAAGLLTHITAVWSAIGRSRSLSHTTVLTTIGLGTAANAAVALLFGAESWPVPAYVREDPINLGLIPVRPIYLVIILAGLFLTVGIERLIQRTALGQMFRATLEDPEGASLLGIDTRKVILSAFGTAGALSGLSGFLVAPVIQASAFTAQELAFFGFAGMAIGGFGSFAGALVGGTIVGLLSGLMPALTGNPQYTLPVLWIVVVAVLLIKPAGILGVAGLFGSTKLREV